MSRKEYSKKEAPKQKFGKAPTYCSLAFLLISCAPAREVYVSKVIEEIYELQKDPNRMAAVRKKDPMTYSDAERMAVTDIPWAVEEYHPLFGQWDGILKFSAKDHNYIGAVVQNVVRAIPGVIDTKTHTAIRF